jgi:hypothetical protein
LLALSVAIVHLHCLPEQELPPELGLLGRLRLLNTSSNRLAGALEPRLARCTALQDLDVSRNHLTVCQSVMVSIAVSVSDGPVCVSVTVSVHDGPSTWVGSALPCLSIWLAAHRTHPSIIEWLGCACLVTCHATSLAEARACAPARTVGDGDTSDVIRMPAIECITAILSSCHPWALPGPAQR